MLKNIIKTVTFVFVFAILSLCSNITIDAEEYIDVSNVDTYASFFNQLTIEGQKLFIQGWAIDRHAQNYKQNNHSYYLVLKNDTTGREFIWDLQTTSQILTLSIAGIDTKCTDTQIYNHVCERIAQWVGFTTPGNAGIDITGVLEEFRLSDANTFSLWLGIRENLTGRNLRARIKILKDLVGDDKDEWYKNTRFTLNKGKYATHWRQTNPGTMVRRYGARNGFWYVSDFMTKPSWSKDTLYVCTEAVCGAGNATFEYAGIDYDPDNTAWLAGWGKFGGTEWRDYTFSTNLTMAPGHDVIFYTISAYLTVESEFVYLTKETYDSADINYITTYTSKPGTNARITASYYNNPKVYGNPINYTLKVDGNVVASGTNDTRTGEIIIDVNVPAVNYDRTVELTIVEAWTNASNTMTTILYATENRAITFTNESGSYRSAKPIMVHTNYGGTINYHETIYYSNPQNYVLTEGNFSGSSLRRQTQLSYGVDSGATNGNIQKYGVGVKNVISSPYSESNASLTQINASVLSTDNTIYVQYTDLNSKIVQTVWSGVGVNNYTITLQAGYQFSDLSSIKQIDTYTKEKTENSHVRATIYNSSNRQIQWYIYFEGALIKSGTDSWTGDRDFWLDNYVVNRNGNITVRIIQSNGVSRELTGKVYVAEESTVTLTQGQTYTPNTPVRVITTPSEIRNYYENITVNSINSNLNISAGEGFENKIQVTYSTQSGDIGLNTNEISVTTTFPEQDTNLSYTQNVEGVIVPLETTNTNSTQMIFELPVVMVEKTEGTLYRVGDAASAGLTLLNGGRRWYTKMTAEQGTYDFSNTITHVGVNAVNIKFYNSYTISGSLVGNSVSKFKVIRVQNPSNPNFTYHKTYKLEELLEAVK